MKRISSHAAYAHTARDFYVAASHLLNYPSDTSLPVLFLIGRSIELSLKSLLLVAGKSPTELSRRPFRHSLTNLLNVAVDSNLMDVEFSSGHRAAVDVLSKEYEASSLGYTEMGRVYLLPRLDLIDEAAALLLKSASRFTEERAL